jgi:two-component system phosphate regulon sensor histidine kinase PhoR
MKIELLTPGVKRELSFIVVYIWLVIISGWITGQWLISIILFIVIYFIQKLWAIRQFESWIQNDPDVSYPPTFGQWGEISYLVSKKQRSLQKHADLLLYKSKQFRAASMQLPVLMISIDRENRIEWFNDPVKKTLQLKRSAIGRKIESLIRTPAFNEFIQKKTTKKDSIQVAIPFVSGRVFELKVVRYFEDHRMVLMTDITELFQSAQIRKDFVANASHELRTPLTVLRGYLELMSDSLTDSSWNQPLAHMENQSIRMQSIIDDLLVLSRLESDAFVNAKEKINVSFLLEGIVRDAKILATEDHDFNVVIQPDIFMDGHEATLKSLFMNLISNAIRYSPDGGGIDIQFSTNKESIVFSVKDEGLGIAKEHISRLTERFYRVDKARSRVTGGTGLGLAIVKYALENNHGELFIESQLGKGSTFSCHFPKSL